LEEILMCPIQFVDLKKQYAPLKADILAGVERILDGMQLFLGENVRALETEFAAFCGAAHGIGVSDGTAALHILLRAMDIGHGDEVITVAHSFIATAEAICLACARPVFVDIDPHTGLMDVAQLEAKITPRTRAILPVHLYGQMVDMDPLLEIARRHDLRVIEDACQAHGAEYRGQRAGSLGDGAAFSFYYSKNLGAYGEGGFITTNDPEIARRCRMIRDHGSEVRYQHALIGLNGRLDEIQAMVCRVKLPHLADWNTLRREHAARYAELLAGTPLQLLAERPECRAVYHLFVVRAPRRDELQAHLKARGIFTGIHYPVPIHLQPAMAYLGYRAGDLPATEALVGDILSLPMFAELTADDLAAVAAAVHEFYQG
jgi:dTDP-4-amino-4,6-dideoxygalactose transaminase